MSSRAAVGTTSASSNVWDHEKERLGLRGATLAPRFFGQRVRRREVPRFLTGAARFIDDIVLPRMLFVSFARSTEAHARIVNVDVAAALCHPKVRAALTGALIAERARPIRCDSTMPTWQGSAYPALAVDKVRFAGEALACVAAEDRHAAEDAALLVAVDYESLPAVVTVADATAPGAPLLHDDWEDNFFIKRHFETEGFDEVMLAAPHRLSQTYTMARHSGVPIEPRGCIAEWDRGAGVLTLRTATQIPHLVRTALADVLSLPSTASEWSRPTLAADSESKGGSTPKRWSAPC